MGKIFGIANLPVSTIMTPFEPVVEFKNPNQNLKKVRTSKIESSAELFLPEPKPVTVTSFVRMRKGFGKLMKHFSKKIL